MLRQADARKAPRALLARVLPLQLTAAKDGDLQSPAAKIAETLELLRNRLGPAQLQYFDRERQEQEQSTTAPN